MTAKKETKEKEKKKTISCGRIDRELRKEEKARSI